MVPFQNTQKILRENTRFTRNSESKREFFTKHPQVNIFWSRPFLALIFEFKLTNHFFYLIVNRLTKGNGQNQAKELCVLRYKFQSLFFPIIVLIFISFVLFFCLCYSMSVQLRFSLLYRFMHFRLLVSISVLLCSVFSGLGFQGLYASARILEVCVRIQLGCTYKPMYKHAYSCRETLI